MGFRIGVGDSGGPPGAGIGSQRGHRRFGDFTLQREQIVRATVVALRPQVGTTGGIDQLHRDPQPVAVVTHAAFDHVVHAERAGDGANVLGPILEREGRRARGDLQRRRLGQPMDQFLSQAIGEVFVVPVRAHIGERQHRDPMRCSADVRCGVLARVIECGSNPQQEQRGHHQSQYHARPLARFREDLPGRVRGGRGHDPPPLIVGDVVPLRQADFDRIGSTLLAVILDKPVAQAPTLYADDGVLARIEVGTAAEHLHAEGVFLEPAGLTRKRLFDHVAQHAAQARGIHEQRAGQDPRQLQANGLLVRTAFFREGNA